MITSNKNNVRLLLAVLVPAAFLLTPVVSETEFIGTTNTRIDYHKRNYDTNSDDFVSTKQFESEVSVLIGDPLSAIDPLPPNNAIVENNPFHFAIRPLVVSAQEGDVRLSSADRHYTYSAGGLALFQHWTFYQEAEGGGSTAVNGTLTHPYLAEGAGSLNTAWGLAEKYPGAFHAWPFPITSGATLEGTITPDSAELTIKGTAFSAGAYSGATFGEEVLYFTMEISATTYEAGASSPATPSPTNVGQRMMGMTSGDNSNKGGMMSKGMMSNKKRHLEALFSDHHHTIRGV